MCLFCICLFWFPQTLTTCTTAQSQCLKSVPWGQLWLHTQLITIVWVKDVKHIETKSVKGSVQNFIIFFIDHYVLVPGRLLDENYAVWEKWRQTQVNLYNVCEFVTDFEGVWLSYCEKEINWTHVSGLLFYFCKAPCSYRSSIRLNELTLTKTTQTEQLFICKS